MCARAAGLDTIVIRSMSAKRYELQCCWFSDVPMMMIYPILRPSWELDTVGISRKVSLICGL